MHTYEETIADIKESLGIVPGWLEALDEETLVREWPFFKRFGLEETVIPDKYRELIGLAVAANIKCPYCQFFHKAMAELQGATEEEIRELYALASFTSRYSSMIHAQHYDYDEFVEEGHKIAEHLQEQQR